MAQRQQELFPLIKQAQTALAFSFASEPSRPKGPAKIELTGGAIALLLALSRGDTKLFSKAGKFEKPHGAPGLELSRKGLVRMAETLAPSQFRWEVSEKGAHWLKA